MSIEDELQEALRVGADQVPLAGRRGYPAVVADARLRVRARSAGAVLVGALVCVGLVMFVASRDPQSPDQVAAGRGVDNTTTSSSDSTSTTASSVDQPPGPFPPEIIALRSDGVGVVTLSSADGHVIDTVGAPPADVGGSAARLEFNSSTSDVLLRGSMYRCTGSYQVNLATREVVEPANPHAVSISPSGRLVASVELVEDPRGTGQCTHGALVVRDQQTGDELRWTAGAYHPPDPGPDAVFGPVDIDVVTWSPDETSAIVAVTPWEAWLPLYHVVDLAAPGPISDTPLFATPAHEIADGGEAIVPLAHVPDGLLVQVSCWNNPINPTAGACDGKPTSLALVHAAGERQTLSEAPGEFADVEASGQYLLWITEDGALLRSRRDGTESESIGLGILQAAW